MKKNVVKDKSFDFAKEIVYLYKELVGVEKEFVMSKQLLKSGASIGANIREAEQAQSKADFISKMSIALKEANETEYWLDLLNDTEFLSEKRYNSLKQKIQELLKLLISILKTARQ